MASIYVYRHAGGLMPCPVCGTVDGHHHDMAEAEFKLLMANPELRVSAYVPSPFAIEAMAERQRQQDVEGFTIENDVAAYPKGDLIAAAVCFAIYALFGSWRGIGKPHRAKAAELVDEMWPWDRTWFKPESRRRSLVKATALLIAEGDRQDLVERRAAEKAQADLEARY
jgi:hypothetical protein